MPEAIELIRQGKTEELWQKCCGFFDLSLEEFMAIQERLLLEQIELLSGCELGRQLLRGIKPRNIREFQRQIPLTTYEDYAPYLLEKREDLLPERPLLWQRTSGRSGEYPCKWVPVSQRMYREMEDTMMGMMILCTAKGKGHIALEEHDKIIYNLAPRPYSSGYMAVMAQELFPLDFLPPIVEAEQMTFQERTKEGFKLALNEGLDMFFGLSSVLVAVGEQFANGGGTKNIPSLLSKPRTLIRLLTALMKSKLARRPLYPKDVWSLKGVIAFGTDTSIYREKVEEMWGCNPIDVYGSAELNIVAIQAWNRKDMTFFPHTNLWEFLPEPEYYKWKADRGYQPDTLLMDEVKAGENYVLMGTNLIGGPFVRYVIGDLIRITSLRDEELNIDTPQMTFISRIDGLIDIAGFTRLTEKVVWQAIENSRLPYADWSIRKEESGGKPILHLYLELKESNITDEIQVATSIHEQLSKLDADYANLESMLGLKPLKVTLLPKGTFGQYMLRQQEAGADLAFLKPPHMNSSDTVLDMLLAGVPVPVPEASSTEEIARQ